jgi:DNA-binding beta-propeller fold protein YncE
MDKCSKENIIEPRFIKLPKGPHDIAVDENTNTLYVSCKNSNLILVVGDTAGNDPIVKSINMKSPSQMQIDQNSKRLYVIGKDDGKIVDTETRDFVQRDDHKTSTFSVRPNGQMVLDPTRGLAYIAQTGLASIEVVDVANGGRVKKVIGTKKSPLL